MVAIPKKSTLVSILRHFLLTPLAFCRSQKQKRQRKTLVLCGAKNPLVSWVSRSLHRHHRQLHGLLARRRYLRSSAEKMWRPRLEPSDCGDQRKGRRDKRQTVGSGFCKFTLHVFPLSDSKFSSVSLLPALATKKGKTQKLTKMGCSSWQDFFPIHRTHNSWLGLTDQQVESVFRWQNGFITSWVNWFPHQPDGLKAANCVLRHHPSGKWTDEDCQTQHPFYCEGKGIEIGFQQEFTHSVVVARRGPSDMFQTRHTSTHLYYKCALDNSAFVWHAMYFGHHQYQITASPKWIQTPAKNWINQPTCFCRWSEKIGTKHERQDVL